MSRSKYILTALLAVSFSTFAFILPETEEEKVEISSSEEHVEIEWLSFEEAVAKNEKEPRKILIDFYTDWCGWCKRMDKATYENPKIAAYINEHYYAIKFDAEQSEPITFQGQEFTNRGPQPGRRGKGTHDLAISLLNGKMSYPTTLFMTEKLELITPIPGYKDAKAFEPIMRFMIEGKGYTQEDWNDFTQNFISEL